MLIAYITIILRMNLQDIYDINGNKKEIIMKLSKTVLISAAVCAALSTPAIAIELDGLMTVKEVMDFLKISRGKLYSLMSDGSLQYVTIGRSRRIPRRAVVELALRGLNSGNRKSGESNLEGKEK